MSKSDVLMETIVIALDGAQLLDKKNLVWKVVDGRWVGKRSVWTFDSRACWLEDTVVENVKSWWCGRESDYGELFYN